MTGAGLVCVGLAFADQRKSRQPFSLVSATTNGTDAPPVQIPPPAVTYEPIYLTEAEQARMQRVKNGTASEPGKTLSEAEYR